MPKTKRIFSLPTETRQQRYLKKKVGALTIRYQQRWGEELVDNLKTVIKLKGGPNFHYHCTLAIPSNANNKVRFPKKFY